MKKPHEDSVEDTQQMEVPIEFNIDLPLPSRTKLSVEIIDGPGRGKVIWMSSGRLIIGRSDADLVLEDQKVSKKHAAIEVYSRTNIFVRDLASTNGTSVNGNQVTKLKLNDGDVIQIGKVKMRFRQVDTTA